RPAFTPACAAASAMLRACHHNAACTLLSSSTSRTGNNTAYSTVTPPRSRARLPRPAVVSPFLHPANPDTVAAGRLTRRPAVTRGAVSDTVRPRQQAAESRPAPVPLPAAPTRLLSPRGSRAWWHADRDRARDRVGLDHQHPWLGCVPGGRGRRMGPVT